MDTNEMLSWREGEAALRDAKEKRKANRASPMRQYWTQGKFYFITNTDHSSFFVKGDEVSARDADDLWPTQDRLTSMLNRATLFQKEGTATKLITLFSGFDAGAFGSTLKGRKRHKFWSEARVGVLVFRARDMSHVHKWTTFYNHMSEAPEGQRCACGAQEWF